MAEIADALSPSPSPFERKELLLTISCIGSDGDRAGQRPPRRGPTSGRKPKKEDNNKLPVGKKANSSNQEEIIALFRRIQSSISKEKSVNEKKKNADASEKKSSTESILNVLRRSGKQGSLILTGKAKNEERKRISTRKRAAPKKDQGEQGKLQVTDSKLTRPRSNFVKRSPIPFPTTPRVISLEPNNKKLTAAGEELDLPKVEEMKLAQLKALAKSRGIKGYSKLKKSELVSLLRS